MTTKTSFFESLMIQKRVIGALILREGITRYGRHNIGFLWVVFEPMVFTGGVTLMYILRHASHGGLTGAQFVLTGYSAILLWRNIPNRSVGALEPNSTLLFHRMVKPLDIFLSRIILEAIGAGISMIVLSLIYLSLGLVNFPVDILQLVEAWFLLAWYATAMSFFVGALAVQTEIMDRLFHIFQYLMVGFSGSLFLVTWLPPNLQYAVLFIPTVHCNEMMRSGFFGPVEKFYFDVNYVIVFNMVLTLLGLAQVRYISKSGARVGIE
jgi:ABC-type polysaccharide/polyol phosphate export permease